MMKSKTPNDARGAQVKCVNFVMCPMCYGCRNEKSGDEDCAECAKNRKKNICNVQLHRADVIANMISKNQVKFEGPIQFKNGRNS